MGVSTDAIICYGIPFKEGTEFPWEDKEIEDWWLEVCGYKEPFKIFTEEGEYIDGIKPLQSVMYEYFKHKREFLENNPLPIHAPDLPLLC